MADPTSFYDVLGVSRVATADELQRAYRKLARTYHPDVNKDPAAESRFKDISEAYDVLSNPETRHKYDAFGADFRRVPDGTDPAAWARSARGESAGPQRRSSRSGANSQSEWSGSGFGGGGDVDLDDLFGSMFGGSRRSGRGPVVGANQEAELILTVDEVFRGGRRSMSFSGPDGPRNIDVNVPAGVTEGQRIRLAGQGAQGTGGASPGDLFLIVRLAPHPRYRVTGRDIRVSLPLTPWEAALGATVVVDTPGGEAKVRVKEGTSTGTSLRLKGRGMPSTRGEPGHLFAEIRIMVPSPLSSDERRLFEELAAASTFDPRASS